MKLGAMAFACYVYDRMTNYDNAYLEFLRAVSSPPNLARQNEAASIINWLNRWGCRQFSKEGQAEASRNIQEWFQEYENRLAPPGTRLVDLTPVQINDVMPAFDAIAAGVASRRRIRPEKESKVTIGPTGAAKILFALRPEAYPAWDMPIRGNQQTGHSERSYSDFLRRSRDELLALRSECERNRVPFEDLPALLGRPRSTHAKLIDEFNWISVTRKCAMPDEETLKKWIGWDGGT